MVSSQKIPQDLVQAFEALNQNEINILDINYAFEEIDPPVPVSMSVRFSTRNADLDDFDWAGIRFANYDYDMEMKDFTSDQPDPIINSKDFYRSIEAIISNGFFWETDDEEFSPSPELQISLGIAPRKSDKQDPHKILRQFNRLPENEIDIFSTDDGIFESNYKVVSNFEVNVPLKVYSEDEDWVIKADLPDIVFYNVSPRDDVFPEQLNFKSVLALLPDRINVRQFKPSFVDGQFRLELPKREELRASR
ncbi:Uncharacterized [Syntrophomonas zehnderi OL-4]|uniref:Uncharacterized n=1 Tax=Syntrophomonas zehnderi OL-4 TaxID=690567 RepID=A0A0E3W3N4_9FIRM|nr:hypothetical protein [Syntrophomonas zehnderi]CFX94837.1 Uncharacterized [Syntrophomonas zehnderi OL-4]